MARVKIEDVQDIIKDDVLIILDESDNAVAYELLRGKYKGIRYSYIDPKIEPVQNGTNEELMSLSFSYYIFNNESNDIKIDDKEFKQEIANIYIKILENCSGGEDAV